MSRIGESERPFEPSGPIVHGEGGQALKLQRRSPEAREQYYLEKIAEGAMTQQELARVTRERDALAQDLREIKRVAQTYNQPERKDSWKWLNEIGDIAAKALEKLASGELRKLTA